MRRNEAEWIAETLATMPIDEISPLLELGSQTLDYRTVQKPHIEEVIHRPLRARGVKIFTTDLRNAPGVDIVGDIYDPDLQAKLRKLDANFILCSRIFPHVCDYKEFAKICDSLVKPGKCIAITTVQSYPYTLDPIDNEFRPTPDELAVLFPQYETIKSFTLVSETYLEELRQGGQPLGTILSVLVRIVLFRGGWEATKARAHRLLCFGRSQYRPSYFGSLQRTRRGERTAARVGPEMHECPAI
jgi:hypothetical protein